MTSPVGLTRAEEEALQPPAPRVVVVAPPGVPTCRVLQPGGEGCPAAATCRIVWASRDGQDKPTSACADCAERLQQLASAHRTILSVEPL